MENQKFCNPCAPIAKAEVTHTEKGENKDIVPTQINISGEYVLYGGLLILLYRLIGSLRRAPPPPTKTYHNVGVSGFIENVSEKYRREADTKEYCQPWRK